MARLSGAFSWQEKMVFAGLSPAPISRRAIITPFPPPLIPAAETMDDISIVTYAANQTICATDSSAKVCVSKVKHRF